MAEQQPVDQRRQREAAMRRDQQRQAQHDRKSFQEPGQPVERIDARRGERQQRERDQHRIFVARDAVHFHAGHPPCRASCSAWKRGFKS